jgi:hypothetical protein
MACRYLLFRMYLFRVPYGSRNGGLPITLRGEEECFVDHEAHISTVLDSLTF